MRGLRRFPVRRRMVALGAIFVVALLAGLIGFVDSLRPHAGSPGTPITPALDSDPREEVRCIARPAREGRRPRASGSAVLLPVRSADLLDCPTTWDGRRVLFRGEVVGAILQRGDTAWLQLNDDTYALADGPLPSHRTLRGANSGVGVLVPLEALGELGQPGGPGIKGDVVEVHGVYHRVDDATGEVAIIRADTLKVLEVSEIQTATVSGGLVAAAAALGGIALFLLAAEWRLRRRWAR